MSSTYKAAEAAPAYTPAQDTDTGASAPHYTVENARDEALNGPITFQYPTAFQEARIGVRMAELAKSEVGVTLDDLPFVARLYLRAIAALEFVIVTAPGRDDGRGWYMRSGKNGQPILAPGQLTNGDEELVLEVFDAYAQWKARFRGAPPEPGDAGQPTPVVPSGEDRGEPTE